MSLAEEGCSHGWQLGTCTCQDVSWDMVNIYTCYVQCVYSFSNPESNLYMILASRYMQTVFTASKQQQKGPELVINPKIQASPDELRRC